MMHDSVYFHNSCSVSSFTFLGKSKVLQYFVEVKNNLAALDVFAAVVKVMNHNGLWDAKLAWYSSNATLLFLDHGQGI